MTQRVAQSFVTFAATFSSDGPTLGRRCFSSPSMRWQPQQPRLSTRRMPAFSVGASGKVRLVGVAAVAARLRELHRQDRRLVEPVELPLVLLRPADPCFSVSGRVARADQNDVARSRPPWQGVQPNSFAGWGDSLPTIRFSRGCVRKTTAARVLEALALGRDVAGRAPVDARDLHEVDVVVVLGQLHLLDAQGRVDHVEDRRVAQLEERVLLQRGELLPGELVVRGELLDGRLELVAPVRQPLDLRLRLRFFSLQRREPTDARRASSGSGRGPSSRRRRPSACSRARPRTCSAPRRRRPSRTCSPGRRRTVAGRASSTSPRARARLLRCCATSDCAAARSARSLSRSSPYAFSRAPPRRLARLLRVEPHERPLQRLPVARVVGDHHPDEHDRQHRARRKEGAVQPRDVVVVIDRLGGRFAGHGLSGAGSRESERAPSPPPPPPPFPPLIC